MEPMKQSKARLVIRSLILSEAVGSINRSSSFSKVLPAYPLNRILTDRGYPATMRPCWLVGNCQIIQSSHAFRVPSAHPLSSRGNGAPLGKSLGAEEISAC